MGLANSAYGEEWVNSRIQSALETVKKSLRSTDLIAQLNSGDEFFIVTKGDTQVVMAKVEASFAKHWPGGIYIASMPVQDSIMEAIMASMDKVYAIKALKKAA